MRISMMTVMERQYAVHAFDINFKGDGISDLCMLCRCLPQNAVLLM